MEESEEDLTVEQLALFDETAWIEIPGTVAPEPYRPAAIIEQPVQPLDVAPRRRTARKEKTCRKCGGSYRLAFFRKRGFSRAGRQVYSARCRGCEQAAREEKKNANRSLHKANDAIIRHARTYIRSGLVKNAQEFRERFGWRAEEIAADMEMCAASGGVSVFGVWIEIADRNLLPEYPSNVRVRCSTR